jgi:hypothetical protein
VVVAHASKRHVVLRVERTGHEDDACLRERSKTCHTEFSKSIWIVVGDGRSFFRSSKKDEFEPFMVHRWIVRRRHLEHLRSSDVQRL